MKEKAYKDFNQIAKEGCDKFAELESSKLMENYRIAYQEKTGKSAYHVDNKEDFYTFVAKEELEYKTLEQQIMELWKSRGMEVNSIRVNKSKGGFFEWTIKAK